MERMAKAIRVSATMLAAGALVLIAGISPATAAPIGHPAETITYTTTIPECLDSLPAGQDPSVCTMTEEIALSAEMQHITPTDPTVAPPTVESDQAGFAAALAAGTVRSRTFVYRIWGGAYGVRMEGRFYYNGSRVWVNSSYGGRTGYMNCDLIYDHIPISITNMTERDQGTTTARNLSCSYRVNWYGPGVTVGGYLWSLRATAFSNGTMR